jgi:glyoxylase-like metal-dependent hydrolase (beta-lactamase superfamily II)
MAAKLYAFTCGHVTVPAGWLLAGATGQMTVPVCSYLVVHPKGSAIFDTGLHVATQTDQVEYLGAKFHAYQQCHFELGEEIAERLKAMQIAPESINYVINSHLHFDHCGGNAQLANADVVVQRQEYEHACSGAGGPGYIENDWATGQSFKLIDGEHDLFGDGSVVILPTRGHTPGHQSLRVQTELGGEFVLCGDACYLRDNLDSLRMPGVLVDADATLEVLKRFQAMQARGATLVFGHDPEQWKQLPKGPERLG